jgi:hypothetical protein
MALNVRSGSQPPAGKSVWKVRTPCATVIAIVGRLVVCMAIGGNLVPVVKI